MNWNQLLGKAIEYGPRVIALVTGAKQKFGDAKTGVEKAKVVKDAITGDGDDAIEIVEGVTGKDVVNNPALDALVDESIELAYQVMKAQERLKVIQAELKRLKGPDRVQ